MKSVAPAGGANVEVDGQAMTNFSSNDYLGLASHPALIEGATHYMARYGAGATASRLVCGNFPCFTDLERRLAVMKGSESALVMNSGFQANVSLIPALVSQGSLVLADRLCHNSINQGILLSRARLMRFRHNDLDHLKELLTAHSQAYARILIVTESVFSMDGDRSDLDALVELSRRYHALLLVDEAHATGVFGHQGMGLTCGKDVDVVMGTFGKGLGSFGAYVACSNELREYLINFCSGFIYSTALPPPVLGAIHAALDLVPTMDQERSHLQGLAQYLRDGVQEIGLSTGNSSTQIVPIIVGEDHAALSLSQGLFKQKMVAAAIRPPTVENGKARVRLTLTCQHDKDQVDRLLHAIRTLSKS
ncbi:MAG: 8-amino-7-oxononanoate synthase [Desulfobulbaceae bacterium]|nr:8-amino-7-oxononanoate synthase [Desulfobulbaceae bacterium]